MRALVFLWVGQNVLLVVSAILRLNLYIETYLLTYWRVAAFIWMLIVAAGLILIVVRIVTYPLQRLVDRRPISWCWRSRSTFAASSISPIWSRATTSRMPTSTAIAGRPVDFTYIAELGPQAIPALDRYLAANPRRRISTYFRRLRDWLAAPHPRDTAELARLDVPRLAPHLLSRKARTSLNTPLSLLRHSAPNRYMQ